MYNCKEHSSTLILNVDITKIEGMGKTKTNFKRNFPTMPLTYTVQ